MAALLLLASASLSLTWKERLAARSGTAPAPDVPCEAQEPPAPGGSGQAGTAAEVMAELRRFVMDEVEPALQQLKEHEQARGNYEVCFATAGGVHFRFRCCVYYSALAAALLEERYGRSENDASSSLPQQLGESQRAEESVSRSWRDDRGVLYRLLAGWFLQPPSGVAAQVDAVAATLIQRVTAADGLDGIREAAKRLPAPLGRYATTIRVSGVQGTLWRCEVQTAHTYLIFESPGLPDIVIDVSFKQFMLMPEWMEERHFEAAKARGLFTELADSFVGTHDELGELMTLDGLAQTMVTVFEHAGDAVTTAPFADARELEKMHRLRNDVMFAMSNLPLRRRICGHAAQ